MRGRPKKNLDRKKFCEELDRFALEEAVETEKVKQKYEKKIQDLVKKYTRR